MRACQHIPVMASQNQNKNNDEDVVGPVTQFAPVVGPVTLLTSKIHFKDAQKKYPLTSKMYFKDASDNHKKYLWSLFEITFEELFDLHHDNTDVIKNMVIYLDLNLRDILVLFILIDRRISIERNRPKLCWCKYNDSFRSFNWFPDYSLKDAKCMIGYNFESRNIKLMYHGAQITKKTYCLFNANNLPTKDDPIEVIKCISKLKKIFRC